jgi:hypothetical protein
MTTITTRAAQYVALVAIASSSAMSQAPARDRDSSVFVAVARSVVTDTAFTPLGAVQVDPRPALDDNRSDSGPTQFAPMLSHRVKRRRDALRALDIPIGDSTRPRYCAGIMIPNSPKTYHKGCPKKPRQVVSIGVPRDSVGGTVVEGKLLLVTRVVLAYIGPAGVSYLSFDYALEPTASGWKVTKGRLVGFVE